MTATVAVPEIRLRPRKALPFFSRHPWVFASAMAEPAIDLPAGAEVVVRSCEGQFIARGLHHPTSHIRVRLYNWDQDSPLDAAFWEQRLDEALDLRRKIFGNFASDLAARLVYSEADRLSGLIVDRYGEWLTIQFTSRALADRSELWFDLLRKKLKPRGIIVRTEKGVREAEGLELQDGLVWGDAPPQPLVIRENDIAYAVDLTSGQKTGFFLDQRDNRRTIAKFANGKRVLDMFCYSGGFALNCLVHGPAAEVIAVDGSQGALDLAFANAELNRVSDRLKLLHEDGFNALELLIAEGEKFSVVVLDPPKLARRRDGVEAALRGYYSLNKLALNVLEPGGLLMTCSCSGHVSHDMFVEMLARVGLDAGRHIQILETRGPGPDHPASIHCLETDYLKCYLCRVV